MAMSDRKIASKKLKEVLYLKENIQKYDVIGLVSMEKIDARSITKLRKALRGKVVMRMSKKRLIKRALSDSNKPNLEKLADEIKGSSALIFTNMNPIELSQFLESNATKGPAKAGDIAPEDIVVPAGDTRIPPGPIISEFSSILKLPTMIKDGTINIREDTVTHEKGDPIDLKQALLLKRLGVEPMTISLDFYSAWENGEILPREVLHLNQEKILNDFASGAQHGLNVALALKMITKATVIPLIARAAQSANALAMNIPGLFIPSMIPQYLAKAYRIASQVNNIAHGIEPEPEQGPAPTEEKAPKEKKEEKKEKEEPAGLGDLFG
ncbi:MAG: 50S ribosomal protein L10 [Candidatus Lokiarchaeota archaeon]|nr:50S ribosomal protein L10 [Candidatus Lokiarchaeota archaeon]